MSAKKSNIHRFHLKDEGQDLLFIDVESEDGEMGSVVGVNDGSAYPECYRDKAVDFDDVKVGDNFNCADPMNGFTVFESRWIIESIEIISLQTKSAHEQ